MVYKIYIDNTKVLSLQGLSSAIACFGKLYSEKKNVLTWEVAPSILHIDCALEYLSRIIDEEAVIDYEEVHFERIKYKRMENTRKKQGKHARKNK